MWGIDNIIFTSFVLDDQKPLESEGRIMCHVLKDGKPDTIFIDKEDLIYSGIMDEITTTKDLTNESEQPAPTEENVENYSLSNDNIWTDSVTKFVLDKYHEYLPEIGPLKRFKVKKRMWQHISEEIKNKFNISKTAQQVENRFKTVLKRKKDTTKTNKKTGEVRQKVEFEEELEKIASQDDSVEPEILKGQSKVIVNKEIKRGAKRSSLCAFLKEISNEKKKQKDEHFKQKRRTKRKKTQRKNGIAETVFGKIDDSLHDYQYVFLIVVTWFMIIVVFLFFKKYEFKMYRFCL